MRSSLVREAVCNLIQLIEAPGGRAGERPKRSDPRNADRRPEGIGRQSVEITIGKLPPRFIDRPRRQGHYVAGRHGLVGVVQSGGGSGGVQRSGAAGVIAVNVIQTIARAEQIVPVELMIHLTQEVRIVNRAWIKTRTDRGSFVAGGCKPGVDRGDARGRNRNETALIQFPLLEVSEVKRTVAD